MRLAPLDRKLLRDLWQIKGQATAVALVMGAGVGLFVLMASTYTSLDLTRRAYYDRARFGDIFASCKRAPLWLKAEIAEIPGVAALETRVVADVTIDVEGMSEPATGRLISFPAPGRPELCDVVVQRGRTISAGRADEVIVSDMFAEVHQLDPGDSIVAVINGRRRRLEIVGTALSPEYVYPIRPGEMMPDDKRFGVFWMERRALATAFDMEGGFNDVVLRLAHGASASAAIARLDSMLEPYGGAGAIPRALQTSHWYLNNELVQLKNFGAFYPTIFLAVAAFLLNVVLSRIVTVQREQIASLKAVGYANSAIGWHYVKWGLAIAFLGSAFGLALGAWLGAAMTRMYTLFFHFPLLVYQLHGSTVVQGVLISIVAAVLGTLAAVRRAVKLPPAEAMRPEPPAPYTISLAERTGLGKWLSEPGRIILRTLQRHPGRAALSVLGIAMGCGLLVLSNFSMDAVDVMTDLQFNVAQRYDVLVTFVEPTSARARHEINRLPGVLAVEGFRAVPVRIRHGHRSRQVAITGVPPNPRLNRVIDASFRPVDLPPEGLVLSTKLADLLGIERGDTVTLEVLEGARPVRTASVSRLVDDYLGLNAYMQLDALHRLMGEGPSLSGAYLMVDDAAEEILYRNLKDTPRVAGVMLKRAARESLDETFTELMARIRAIYVFFASIIAFGVVYNGARISLADRSRELATLRVIGFTRGEISYILLGELAILTILAVPLGMLAGYGMAAVIVQAMDFEAWRIPLVIFARTYVFAVVTIVVATCLSALVVRRKLDRLDLVAVLKTRE